MGDSIVIFNAATSELEFRAQREGSDTSGSEQRSNDDFFEESSNSTAHVDDVPNPQAVVHFEELHCHNVPSKTVTNKKARQIVRIVTVLCSLCMLLETIGYITGNLFIITDFTRLIPDLASYLISLFALNIAERSATKRYNFGYRRAEIIGALTSVLIIWGVTGHQILSSIISFGEPYIEMDTHVMMTTSWIGLAINTLFAWIVCTKAYCQRACVTANKQDVNVTAVMLHIIRGLLTSVGEMSGVLVIKTKPEWTIAGPISTILFSCIIFSTTVCFVNTIVRVLMEGVPPGIQFEQVRSAIQKQPGVIMVHNLRICALSMTTSVVSCHLVIEPGSNSNNILVRECTSILKTWFGFSEVTIQVEDFNSSMLECRRCQELN